MSDSILKLFTFFFTGIGMAAVPVALTFLLWRKPKKADSYKLSAISSQTEPYESGMPAVGPGRVVGFDFFIYAILFLLFDVVAILMFLGVLALRGNKAEYIWPFLLLIGLLLLILAYGAKKREYIKI